MQVAAIIPSDSAIYRCWQMVPDFIYTIISLFKRIVGFEPDVVTVERKLGSYQRYFDTEGKESLIDILTPQEMRLLQKDQRFQQLNKSAGAECLRKAILDSLPEGVSIFVTSRCTARLMNNQRFSLAEIFRYLGGRDLKHIGFLVKTGQELRISHIEQDHHKIEQIADPLIFAHTFVMQYDISSIMPVEKREVIQKLFNETLQAEVLKERGKIPNMGGWVFLPFFCGHKRLTYTDSFDTVQLKEGQREMCSSFVSKILLIALRALEIPYPIPKNEILERIHIVRFFHLFSPYLKEISFPPLLAKAVPSPAQLIARFLRPASAFQINTSSHPRYNTG